MNRRQHQYLALILTFFLGVQEGKIVLWQAGSPQPRQIFPYRAETLPPAVRSALEAGIAFDTAEEALETAENYFS